MKKEKSFQRMKKEKRRPTNEAEKSFQRMKGNNE